jgi:hypothetical protein
MMDRWPNVKDFAAELPGDVIEAEMSEISMSNDRQSSESELKPPNDPKQRYEPALPHVFFTF